MNNPTLLNAQQPTSNSPVEAMLEQDEMDQPRGLVNWWYWLTAPPEISSDASFVKRETMRQARLLSAVVFFLVVSLVMILPMVLFLPKIQIFFVVLGMVMVSCLSLAFNRLGYTLLAGIMVITVIEWGIVAVIFVLTPLDIIHLPTFDMLVMGELLAVSLLPARSVFIVAAINIVFIFGDLRFQSLTPLFQQYLATQYDIAVIRPVVLQVIVAGVAYLWARSATLAIARADRAEMIAILEHQLSTQRTELEAGIQQILHTHALVAQGDLTARAALNKDHLLWQVASSLNTFLGRYQRAHMAELELQQVVYAVSSLSSMTHDAIRNQKSLELPMTRTVLDPLTVSFNGMLMTLGLHASPHAKNGLERKKENFKG